MKLLLLMAVTVEHISGQAVYIRKQRAVMEEVLLCKQQLWQFGWIGDASLQR